MSCLICVKQHGYSTTKLELDRYRTKPAVSKNRFSAFSEILHRQRNQLLGEVREKIAASGETLGFANQSKITDDDAIADAAAELDVAMVMRESRELQDIEAALQRIHDGSYGICIDCEDVIGHARLKAYPTAQRCLTCQEAYERAHGASRTARP